MPMKFWVSFHGHACQWTWWNDRSSFHQVPNHTLNLNTNLELEIAQMKLLLRQFCLSFWLYSDNTEVMSSKIISHKPSVSLRFSWIPFFTYTENLKDFQYLEHFFSLYAEILLHVSHFMVIRAVVRLHFFRISHCRGSKPVHVLLHSHGLLLSSCMCLQSQGDYWCCQPAPVCRDVLSEAGIDCQHHLLVLWCPHSPLT